MNYFCVFSHKECMYVSAKLNNYNFRNVLLSQHGLDNYFHIPECLRREFVLLWSEGARAKNVEKCKY